MKSLGGDGQPVLHGVVTAEEALRYAMSLPVATIVSGIDSLDVLRQNLAIARGFQPMTAAEMEALRKRVRPGRRGRPPGAVQVHDEVRRRRSAASSTATRARSSSHCSRRPG